MTQVVVAACGALVGLGLLRLRGVWYVSPTPPSPRWPRPRSSRTVLRSGAAVGSAMAMWSVTRWPVMAVVAGVAGWWAPTGWAARGRTQRELAVVEAMATWAEQLRDTLAAAAGLEHAVAATARLAHGPLDHAMARLVTRLDEVSLGAAMADFAAEVRHPSADFVAAALITATEHEARDMGTLLGQLASSARDEARLRRRVWVGRARTRSATRLIAGVTVVVVAGLRVANPGYLDAFADPTGQVVLAGIVATFAAAFATMERLSRLEMPERFTLRVRSQRRPS